MSDLAAGHTIPDVALHCLGGGDLDPADLRGQKLVVFFCPADAEAAAREIEEFRALSEEFARSGVWVMGVLEGAAPPQDPDAKGHIKLGEDAGGCAWAHFEPGLHRYGKPDRAAGAAFFFERWGSLSHAWPSSGHAREILEAARARG